MYLIKNDKEFSRKKLCTFYWPLSQLVDLTNILNNYKDFKTKDVEESGRGFSKVMSSGLPMPVSKTLFRKFGRLTSSQVEEMKKPVIETEKIEKKTLYCTDGEV